MAYIQVSDDVNIEYISQFANRNIETDIKKTTGKSFEFDQLQLRCW